MNALELDELAQVDVVVVRPAEDEAVVRVGNPGRQAHEIELS